MLEDYLAFAKGDGGEEAAPTNVGELLGEVQEETEHLGTPIEVRMRQPKHELVLPLKRQAFKRAVTNLVTNAARFGDIVIIRAGRGRRSGCASRSTTTVRASRRPSATTSSARSTGSTTRATRTPATPAWGWPSPATSPAAMAATSRSVSARMGGLRATMRVPL